MQILLLALALTTAADEPAARTLRGLVTGENGRPLAGVLVTAAQPFDARTSAKIARTDAAGRYELRELPPLDPRGRVQVLALKRGLAAGAKMLAESKEGQLDFVLPPAKVVSVTVVDPAGMPVASAEVHSMHLIRDRTGSAELHASILREFPTRADAAGKLQIDILPADQSFALEVLAAGFGRQRGLWLVGDFEHPLRLRAVGSIAGQLKFPAGRSPEGIEIEVEVRAADDPYFIAWGSAKADGAGKFRIPEIAAGKAHVNVVPELTGSLRPGTPAELLVEAGKTAEVALEVLPVVQVTGTVVEIGSGRPIAGAKVSVHNYTTHRETIEATTDEKGVYRTSLGAGTIGADVIEVAPPHYAGVQNRVSGDAKQSGADIELPPLQVQRGIRREGVVVGADGRPVASAFVTAMWREEQKGLSTLFRRYAFSDAAGRFAFDAVSSQIESYFQAETQDQATTQYTQVAQDNQEPLQLTVSAAGAAVVEGRIVDERGLPLAGAQVQITGGSHRLSGMPQNAGVAASRLEMKTDAAGRFATPTPLPRTLAKPKGLDRYVPSGYPMTISAAGRLSQRIQLEVGAGTPFVLGEITLRRVGLIQGRAVDRQGQPVVGVAIQADGLERTRLATATTDSGGRFTLKDVHPAALFLCARHTDYAFTGALIPSDNAEISLVLARPAEAAADSPLVHLEPTPLEKLDALHHLLAPLWGRLDPAAGIYGRTEILAVVAPHDAKWVLGKLPEIKSARYQIRVLVALGQLEEAIALTAALGSADERGQTLTWLARELKNPGRSRELLGEAAVEARTIVDPVRRLSRQVYIADVLYQLGDREAAKKIIDGNLPEIEKLEAGFPRGSMAETVALFDVEKALKLCEGGTDEYERDRHLGNIARGLAARDPAKAEELVRRLSERYQQSFIAPVCYQMAPVDLPRARRIADAALPAWDDPKAYAYGVMALAIKDKDAAAARQLLRQALDLVPRDGGLNDARFTFGRAMALVHLSEQVDPAATREYVWRALALYSGTHITPTQFEARDKYRADGQLAVLLHRYGLYPEIAAALARPLFTTDKVQPRELREGVFPIAMAVTDQNQTAAWLGRYMAGAKGDDLRIIPQPWELMAPAIAGDDAGFWRSLHKHVLHLWIPAGDEP